MSVGHETLSAKADDVLVMDAAKFPYWTYSGGGNPIPTLNQAEGELRDHLRHVGSDRAGCVYEHTATGTRTVLRVRGQHGPTDSCVQDPGRFAEIERGRSLYAQAPAPAPEGGWRVLWDAEAAVAFAEAYDVAAAQLRTERPEIETPQLRVQAHRTARREVLGESDDPR